MKLIRLPERFSCVGMRQREVGDLPEKYQTRKSQRLGVCSAVRYGQPREVTLLQ
jgi:hypothetical protein